MEDIEYYRSQPDYADIAPYLSLDPDGYEPDLSLPKFEPDYESSIVVDGTPITTTDKVPKLLGALLKVFIQFCPNLTVDDIELPVDSSTGSTYGFCFIKFESKDQAERAVELAQGFAMGKNIFKLSKYADLIKYGSLSDEFVNPTLPSFKPRPDPTDWLCDPLGRDQFVVRYAKETEVYWASASNEEPVPVYCGEHEKATGRNWCENRVSWSPQGSYLATFHPPGIKLWGNNGNDQFHALGRLLHDEVEDIDFSPCETYATTYRLSPKNPHADPQKAISFWNIFTGENIRNFKVRNPLEPKYQVKATIMETKSKVKDAKPQERIVRGRVLSYDNGFFSIEEGNETHDLIPFEKVEPLQEPNRFKWSPDGQFTARVGADTIQVYTLPDMQLVDKKSIPTKDIIDFSWSPRNNLISYWSPAVGNHPATINIIEIPSKNSICSRKFFDVVECKMIWQNNGDYLCVKMHNKKKINILVLFRLNDSGVPVEQLEFTEFVQNVIWEPNGDRFVVIIGERNPTISFYSMAGQGVAAAAPSKDSKASSRKEVTPLFNITGISCNDAIWSPAGGIIVLAHFTSEACNFQFHDVDANLKLANKSHPRCNRLYWDPSGRLLVSCTITELRNINVRGNPEDGFNIYSFQGVQLVQVKREKLFFFLWRPRPKDILSAEAKKNIVKQLKKYEKIFEREDRLRLEESNKEILAQRRRQAEEFLSFIQRNRNLNVGLKQYRVQSRDGYDSDDENNYQVEVQVKLRIALLLRQCTYFSHMFYRLLSKCWNRVRSSES